VEAACKLARRVKRRANLVAFTNSYHGLTAGSLALTANGYYRNESYVNRANVAFLPYDGYFGQQVDTIDYIEKMLTDQASGVDHPAAVTLNSLQRCFGLGQLCASGLDAGLRVGYIARRGACGRLLICASFRHFRSHAGSHGTGRALLRLQL